MKKAKKRTRYPFCWSCSRKLWGHGHRTVRLTDRDADHVHLHSICALDMISKGEAEIIKGTK